MFAVVPAHGNDRVRVTSRDSLQGQLHGEIEVLAQDRLDALDHFATIDFECIGHVVVSHPENSSNEPVGQAVQNQLVPGIVNRFATLGEPRTENAVVAFLQFAISGHQIVGVV